MTQINNNALLKILECGRLTPSADNSQPRLFKIIANKSKNHNSFSAYFAKLGLGGYTNKYLATWLRD